jgi:hypothetical protein
MSASFRKVCAAFLTIPLLRGLSFVAAVQKAGAEHFSFFDVQLRPGYHALTLGGERSSVNL